MLRWIFFVGCIAVNLAGTSPAADPAPVDIAEYKTTATAAKAIPLQGSKFQATLPGHLGVYVEAVGNELRVTNVEFASAAEAARLKVGDSIKSIMGQSVTTVEAVRQQLANRRAGETISMIVVRDGKDLTAQPVLHARSNPMRDRPVLGVQLIEHNDGVQIQGVVSGSPAENAGLLVGDIVTRIEGSVTKSLEDLRSNVGERYPGDVITVEIRRADAKMALPVKIALPSLPEDMPTLTGWNADNPRTFRRPVYRLAVIPIAFNDVTLNEKAKPADWEAALFSSETYKEKSATGQTVYGSMNDYYNELSFGKFKVTGKVFSGVTVGKKRLEYAQTSNRSALLTEACDQLMARDGDDALKDYDGIFFIYAGRRVATQRGGIYWPHRSGFSYKGKRWGYFICPEGGERAGSGSASERMASISVISHEFGHMLGLPDLYQRPEFPGEVGLGIWCSMSSGHGQDGKPLHFSAWCKEQMGWLKPTVIDPRVKQKLILSPVQSNANECYKVLLRPDGSEYLLLENRIKKNFDRDLPGEGMLIWRVVDGRPVLEESHGIGGNAGTKLFLGAVPFPSPSNRSFTPDTVPSSRSMKSGAWWVHITDIRRLDDGRITFQIGYEYL